MSEVEKLYKNAGVKADRIVCYRGFDNCIYNDFNCHCHNENPCKDAAKIYPQFTAEAQLELLKICFDKYERLEKVRGLKERCIIYYHFESNGYKEFVNCETWEETIAGLINNLWQDLTEEEKQQVKGILE